MTKSVTLTIRPSRGGSSFAFRELIAYHELLYFLVWRDIKVKYKQTVLGASWAVLQPLITMVIFSLLFGRLAQVPSDGVPYPIFVYTGLLPWIYFSTSISNSGNSLVANSSLITKVYFPRVIIPTAAALSGLLDFLIASVILVGMMVHYRTTPTLLSLLLIPALMLMLVVITIGCGLWLSALNVEYRDFRYIIPFLVQTWMFLTPVIYPVTFLPERYQWILSLNPLGGVIGSFRAAILGHQPVRWDLLGISCAVGVLIFVTGLRYFRKVERSFSDVI